MKCPRCGYRIDEKSFRSSVTKSYHKAYTPWSPEDDQMLVDGARGAIGVVALAKQLQRQPTAVMMRAEKLGITLTPAEAASTKTPTEAFAEDERKAMEEK